MELVYPKLKENTLKFINELKNVFFPCYFASSCEYKSTKIAKELYKKCICDDDKFVDEFFSNIPFLKEAFEKDIEATFMGDPACDNKDEIIIAYPGFAATFYHRIAHILYKQNFKLSARIISEEAHFRTGIDIHPGATIGEYFFIDHGTGIVIGETTTIGNHVRIYQGVTLGALSLAKGQALKGTKRHPTIKDNVTIYSGVSILGGNTIIGENSIIGSNVFLLESIEPNTKVTITKPELICIKVEKK